MTSSAPEILAAVRRHAWVDPIDRLLIERLRGSATRLDAESDAALTLVLATLCRACAEGSLCLPLNEGLEERLRESARAIEIPLQENGAGRFLDDLASGKFEDLVGTLAAPRALVLFAGNLYLHRFWYAERAIAEGLAARRGRALPVPEGELEAVLRETLETNPLRAPDGGALVLTDTQRAALVAALGERVFVLSGGPGTGKTTWTAAWLRAVLRLRGVAPERVRLCAPTGRAARRLEESLRERLAGSAGGPFDDAARAASVTTLHALLGYRAFEGRFARGPEDPLDADWILLDEASMADVFLLSALVRALPPHARLVLAGDPDQLPAVEAGAVLSELLPARPGEAGPVPSVTLDVGHRARGEVAALATALRKGDADALDALLGEPLSADAAFAGCAQIARIAPPVDAADAPSTFAALMEAFARDAFGPATGPEADAPGGASSAEYAALLERFRALPLEEEGKALDALWRRASRARVLAPLREGPVSAERANRVLRERLEPRWRRPGDTRGAGFHGAPILVTRNDERTGLSNGDVGLWLESGDGAVVFFPRADAPEGWLRLQAALLPPHQLGFASTVHKSQGSEYEEVLILLPEEGNRLLSREVLYTALTRARRKARLYASEAALREAVTRRLVRHGGLRAWFREEPPPPAGG